MGVKEKDSLFYQVEPHELQIRSRLEPLLCLNLNPEWPRALVSPDLQSFQQILYVDSKAFSNSIPILFSRKTFFRTLALF